MKMCTLCGREFSADEPLSEYAQAGEWLAGEVWNDAGELCPQCLENRARLVMMYCPEINS